MKVWRKEILTSLALLTTIQACYAVAVIEKLSEHRAVHDLRGRLTQYTWLLTLTDSHEYQRQNYKTRNWRHQKNVYLQLLRDTCQETLSRTELIPI